MSLSACLNAVETMMDTNEQLYELPKDCDFTGVGNNDSNKYDCSPRLINRFTSPFIGLLINAPEEVVWSSEAMDDSYVTFPNGDTESPYKLMVAGLSKVPDSTLDLDGDVAFEILLVAVNQETAESFSGKMIRFGESSPLPPGVVGHMKQNASDSKADNARLSYFNIDLVQNLDLPITNAVYTVYATLGKYKSNVLTIKTSLK